jgi:hypothetical protein
VEPVEIGYLIPANARIRSVSKHRLRGISLEDYYGFRDRSGVQIHGRWLSVGRDVFQLTNFFQQQTKMLVNDWNHSRANNLVIMQDDNITQPPPEQEPEPEQEERWPLLVRFHTSLFRVDNPPPNWSQEKAGEVAECSKCGVTLTFCFVARLDEQLAGFAGSYQTPVAVRCSCFVQQPIPIVFVRPIKS